MVIYNVTINVEESIVSEWLEWMKTVHIPHMMETGKFQGHRCLRILSRADSEEGETFAVQYFCENLKKLQEYEAEFATKLRKEHSDKYGDKIIAFRTILEDV